MDEVMMMMITWMMKERLNERAGFLNASPSSSD
jgi:hypothetical protein